MRPNYAHTGNLAESSLVSSTESFLSEHQIKLVLRPLPTEADSLLRRHNAPQRLIAHHILVHDVAAQLVDAVQTQWPSVQADVSAVLLGSAWHDIGKVEHPVEVTGPGHLHEIDGVQLLLRAGISPYLARFAQTHAQWAAQPNVNLDDLLVALA